jgi:hypothetical protein
VEVLGRYSKHDDQLRTLQDRLQTLKRPHPAPEKRVQQRQTRLTQDQQLLLVAAYKAGATLNDLRSEFGVHTITASATLERHGVPRRKGRPRLKPAST